MIYETYDALCSAVGKIDPDAEKYMRTDAKDLSSFSGYDWYENGHKIGDVFVWEDSVQGQKYWENIYNQMEKQNAKP